MKNIVVTGSNRGIGKEIARQLTELGHHVIITARDITKGLASKKELMESGSSVAFVQLDLSSNDSIQSFSEEILSNYPFIDVLINNAGIFIDGNHPTHNIDIDKLDETLKTNLYGPIHLSKLLIPSLQKGNDPRIINVSCGMGAIDDLNGGYPAYRISKTALNAYTKNLAAELPNFKINAVCPGWVRTEMGGESASRSVEQGAETPVWLATEKGTESGKFWRDKKVIPW